MTDAIIEFFRNLIGNDFITVIIISMIPLIELRGSIPVAIAMGINPFFALLCAWCGSVIIAPILLLILRPILNWMKKCKIFSRLANAVESIFQGKAAIVESKVSNSDSIKKAERKKLLGVFTFVALPIPLTGVWTGSAVAAFMGLGFWKSFLMVSLGNLVAGSIITILSVFLSDYIDIIIYCLLAIVVVALVFYIVKLVMHMKKDKMKQEANNSNNVNENTDSNILNDSINDNIENDNNLEENKDCIEENNTDDKKKNNKRTGFVKK